MKELEILIEEIQLSSYNFFTKEEILERLIEIHNSL